MTADTLSELLPPELVGYRLQAGGSHLHLEAPKIDWIHRPAALCGYPLRPPSVWEPAFDVAGMPICLTCLEALAINDTR